jgi:type III restriction enzyme
VAYDEHAELLYDLAEQVVTHLESYLSVDDARRVLRLHQAEIARFVHAQMQKHFWQDTDVDYDVAVTRGFTALRPSAYTAAAGEPPLDFRNSPVDKSNMSKYLFGGFSRCLYSIQKFQSDAERKLAVILEREATKWFKPAKGQFQIYYKWGADNPEYQPDFVAETQTRLFMLEPKASNQMTDGEVLAKKEAAVRWCQQASEHARSHKRKSWTYALIPHDSIAENMTLDGLVRQYS